MQAEYKMSCMSHIYKQIQKAIEKGPKSRYRLSMETGIEQSQLSRFIAGTHGLGMESIEKLAKALGYEIIMRKRENRRKKV
jgi:transcriptional regulator with XRE-family HTH domain